MSELINFILHQLIGMGIFLGLGWWYLKADTSDGE